MASTDPFDDLLGLEDGFYKEGYDAGVADSAYAGLIEGKVFGIEKGYEKALELGRLHGRALIWKQRLVSYDDGSQTFAETDIKQKSVTNLAPLPKNARLVKHVEVLLSLTDPNNMLMDNSDASVTVMDDKIMKSKARAKMISTMVGEAVEPSQAAITSGIEDATGLSARH